MDSTGRPPSAEPLGVLVDAVSLSDSSRFRGIGTYTRELLRALARRDDIVVWALATRDAELPPDVRRVPIARVAPGRWAAREHAAMLPVDVARAQRRRRIGVVHSPSVYAPRWCGPPRVQTICDVPLPGGEGNYAALSRSVRRSDRVICISQDTGRAAVSAFGLEESAMTIAPLGFNEAFSPGQAVSKERSLLFVGEYDPRKRHDVAIDVHNEIIRRGHAVRLRFIGRVAAWFADQWQEILDRSVRPDLVDVDGYVSLETLRDAYRSAEVVLVTSDHEGFGLPALEAMACGAPVVAFGSGATAEVISDGGRLIAPGDFADFVDSVEVLLRDPVSRAELRQAAIARASTYSWARCAELHVSAYRAAILGVRSNNG